MDLSMEKVDLFGMTDQLMKGIGRREKYQEKEFISNLMAEVMRVNGRII